MWSEIPLLPDYRMLLFLVFLIYIPLLVCSHLTFANSSYVLSFCPVTSVHLGVGTEVHSLVGLLRKCMLLSCTV